MKKLSNIYIYLIPFILIIWLSSCLRQDNLSGEKVLICDAEKTTENNKQFIASNDSSYFFAGGQNQTSIDSYGGKYSVLTTPQEKAFAFGFKLNNPKADSYFKLSVWRKSKDGKGVLVIAAKDTKDYYQAIGEHSEKGENGWEKLEMEFFVPPLSSNKNNFTFYVWNNSSDTVYFDDFIIEKYNSKTYPKYTDEPLSINLDTSKYMKLYNKRRVALANGVLQTTDNDWVKGFVFGDGKIMKSKMRLKGDWLDHLKGDKWSFRIKMRKNYSWQRLRTFSVQTPLARNYLLEWTSHKYNGAKDILTTRYGFVPLYINNTNKGIYAWEEHFVKQLLESKNRREGPIVKFTEDAFWQTMRTIIKYEKYFYSPYFESSVIKPFSTSKTLESPTLKAQFLEAQKLMQQYKSCVFEAEDIFDLDKLAAYYAMLDLTHARHGMAWHNQRFYFNPVIQKLEPIAFDGYTEHSIPDLSIDGNFYHTVFAEKKIDAEKLMYYNLFKQKKFVDKYLGFLYEFSEEEFVDSLDRVLFNDIVYYDSLLRMEFSQYEYDINFFKKSAKAIRNYLPELEKEMETRLSEHNEFVIIEKNYLDTLVYENTPEFFVNAYLQKRVNDSALIDIQNYYSKEIIILGTARKDKQIDYFEFPEPLIEGFSNQVQQAIIVTDTSAKFLFFMVKGYPETFKIEINLWPLPTGKTPQQELMTMVDLPNNSIIERIELNRIFIKKGDHVIDKPVVIPEGYEVYFNPATKIDLIDSALFLSYSPVFMNGTKDEPIFITSSDFSAMGFTVLQAEGRSQIKNVVFENLNTLNYKGWTLTGAVSFYESDVDISYTRFYRNQCEDALNIIRSDFYLSNSEFSFIYADAFDSDFSTGEVLNTTFVDIGNDAIDFSGSEILIRDTKIINASDKGISGGEESTLTVENCIIEHSNIGIASKDLSKVVVKSSQILDCNYGIVLLKKKPEYGPAAIILDKVDIINAKKRQLIEIGSVVINNGVEIKGTEKNVSELFY